MARTPVSSSNLASVGYDSVSGTLEVEFLSGTIYQYTNVPSERYSGLINAPSKGDYFNFYIKEGGYAFKQVR
ncbi:MAG: KTSC domain-containing protein [Verrucomicrobia bacterium]|nr:KTSC domain-containing protein [Verrucomicrobiota bacterium]